MNKLISLATAILVISLGGAEPKNSHQAQPSVNTKAVVAKATTKEQSLTVSRIDASKAFGKKTGEKSLFIKRLKTGETAERFFRGRGVNSDKAIIAILVNAWHECKWDYTDASGSCIGFFQLNRAGGMGKGHSVAKLKQLVYNMTIMADSKSFKEWVAWTKKNPNATAGEMSYRFAAKVERCAVQHRAPRRPTADRWYKALK
jgi:hypothetical protein